MFALLIFCCCFMQILYICIISTRPLSDSYIGDIFSQFENCLYIHLLVSFSEHVFLIIIHLSLIYIIDLCFLFKKYFLYQGHKYYYLCFILDFHFYLFISLIDKSVWSEVRLKVYNFYIYLLQHHL